MIDRLPLPVRRAASRVRRRVREGRARVALVVLLDGEPAACRRTVDAALAQTEQPVEVLLVPLTASLQDAARERATTDSRVRVVAAVGASRTAARRRALGVARAPYAVVLVPGAVLLPGAVRRLLARRAETGAPVVVGGLDVDGVTDLSAAPQAARTPLLARLLADRTLLRAQESTIDDADGTVTALGLLRSGFAGEAAPTVHDTPPNAERELYRSSPWAGAADLLAAIEATDGLLRDRPDAAAQRRIGLVERDLARLAEAVEDADDAAWRRLVDLLNARVSDDDLADVDVVPRLLVWLARAGVRRDLVRFVAGRRFAGDDLPTRSDQTAVVAVLPDLPVAVPAAMLVVPPRQLALRSRLVRVRRDAGDLELEVYAGIALLDHPDPAQVEARVDLVHGERHVPTETVVHADAEVDRWFGARGQDHAAGRLVARVNATDLEGRPWRVHVTFQVGHVRRGGPVLEIDPRGSATRAARVEGHVEVDARTAGPLAGGALEATIDAAGLEVQLAGEGPVVLAGDGVDLPGVRDGESGWRIPLRHAAWGRPEAAAPSGPYRLLAAGAPVSAAALLDRLPEVVRTAEHRVVLVRTPDGGLGVRLGPPLAEDELAPRAQARLQAAYARVEEPLDPRLVYFQSFTGEAPNDNPLAIAEELRRRVGPEVRLRWMVADAAAGVPAGTEPVLHRSREWYDVLARAAYVVTNVDLDRWFVRRPGQAVLQTSHGYLSKRMGIDQWRARNWPPSRIEQALARSSGTWTALITPQRDVDPGYRRLYAYDGPILAEGYPRDDVLVAPGVEERRAAARSALGVGDRRVVLYAPTWRDDLATDFRSALAEHFLDLPDLAARLGPDWLVLLRGHRFHAAETALDGSTGVLDVTTYPDVNDLILAADAAVLDYSSLRFDFALTGRPAVYLVPDLDRYVGEVRGFLQPFADTAPGPLVDTTAEVARELLDLDGLSARYSGAIAAFNARYSSRQDGRSSQRVVDAFFADLLRRS